MELLFLELLMQMAMVIMKIESLIGWVFKMVIKENLIMVKVLKLVLLIWEEEEEDMLA